MSGHGRAVPLLPSVVRGIVFTAVLAALPLSADGCQATSWNVRGATRRELQAILPVSVSQQAALFPSCPQQQLCASRSSSSLQHIPTRTFLQSIVSASF